jgi:hypothetical protein
MATSLLLEQKATLKITHHFIKINFVTHNSKLCRRKVLVAGPASAVFVY